MTGTLGELAVALAVFLLTHLFPPSEPLRSRLVSLMGEAVFRVVFSTLSIGAIVWVAISYAAAPMIWLWYPAVWQWFVPLLVMPVALAFLVGGVSTRNPASLVPMSGPTDGDLAQGILRVTRHPVMWAIGLWGAAHMVPNGDLASLLLFASMALLAVGGTRSIEAKAAERCGVVWTVFAETTSNVPFAAILQGRQSFALAIREFGLVRLAITAVLYGALLHLHGWLFGVTAMPPV